MNDEKLTKGASFPGEGQELVNRQLYQVPISELVQNPDQPRKHFDEVSLSEMEASINDHGVLQPVIFQKTEGGQLVIVSGERRFRASQNAGLETIPAIYHDESDSAVIALVENLQRENLTPVEEAEALQKLKDEREYDQKDIAALVGKAVPTVSEILSLNKLPVEIRDECRSDRRFSRRKLLDIARADTEQEMEKAFSRLKKMMAPGDKQLKKKGVLDPVEVLVKKADSLAASLKKADLTSLGDRRSVVDGAMRELAAVIHRLIVTEVKS